MFNQQQADISPKLNKIVTAEEIIRFQDLVRKVPVADNVIEFAVNSVNKTRPQNEKNSQMVNQMD